MIKIRKIISGGQTGTDQAALKAGQKLGFKTGGWCPPGRICENGKIPPEYQLQETESERSDKATQIPRSQRTEFNVRDSDATLILLPQHIIPDEGTDCTIKFAAELDKPYLIVDPYIPDAPEIIIEWLNQTSAEILNIAGPSETNSPGINTKVYNLLIKTFSPDVYNKY